MLVRKSGRVRVDEEKICEIIISFSLWYRRYQVSLCGCKESTCGDINAQKEREHWKKSRSKDTTNKINLISKMLLLFVFCLIYDSRYVFMLDLYLHLSFEWRTLFQFLSLFPPLEFVLYFHFAFCDLTFRICLVIEDSCFYAASIFSFVSPTPLSHSLYQLCRIVITK